MNEGRLRTIAVVAASLMTRNAMLSRGGSHRDPVDEAVDLVEEIEKRDRTSHDTREDKCSVRGCEDAAEYGDYCKAHAANRSS